MTVLNILNINLEPECIKSNNAELNKTQQI